jgi:hypothetical protein
MNRAVSFLTGPKRRKIEIGTKISSQSSEGLNEKPDLAGALAVCAIVFN